MSIFNIFANFMVLSSFFGTWDIRRCWLHCLFVVQFPPKASNGHVINNDYYCCLDLTNGYLTSNEIIYPQFLDYNYTQHI
jgi:hypothetical protein